VRELCLLVATRLHGLMSGVRIVGGLVPSLIIHSSLGATDEPHVGTLDLDLGLQVTVLDRSQYQAIANRLRGAGFENDRNDAGNPTRQRWVHSDGLTVDFLIPPASPESKAGSLQDLESDFAAVITLGLDLAFQDYLELELVGNLPTGEEVSRPIWVCGPGAFLILKALAFRDRAEPKDAYDLHYVLLHWAGGIDEIVERICGLADSPQIETAIDFLKADFATIDSVGPGSIDRFVSGDTAENEDFRADISARVLEFCRRLENSIESS